MRAPILVVIFDFLIGALMLFIVAPDTGYRAVRDQGGEGSSIVSEFSPAAIAAHQAASGAEWDALWTQQQLAEAVAENQRLGGDIQKAQDQVANVTRDANTTRAALESEKSVSFERAKEIALKNAELAEEQKQRALLDEQNRRAAEALQAANREIEASRQRATDLAAKLDRSEITAAEYQRESAVMKNERNAADQRAAEASVQAKQAIAALAQNAEQTAALRKELAGLSGTVTQTGADIKTTIIVSAEATQVTLRETSAILADFSKTTTAQNQKIQADIGKLDSSIAALPEQLRSQLAPLQSMQADLTRQSTLLAEATTQLQSVLTPVEMELLTKQVRELGEAQAGVQKQIQAAAETAATALGSETVKNIDTQLTQLRDQAVNIGSAIEQANARADARSRGPYQAVVAARTELSISMVEEDDYDPNDSEKAQIFPLLFTAGNRRFVAASHAALKLNWKELVNDGDLISLTVTYGRPPGDNRWSNRAGDFLLSLAGEPKVVLLEISDSRAGAMAARPLVGRAAIQAKGPAEVYLVKATMGAPIFRVEASVNQANQSYLQVKRPAVPFTDELPFIGNRNAQPEAGDHLVTAEGNIIGIMIGSDSAYILDPSDVNEIGIRLPISDHRQFVQQARALRDATE